MNGSAPGKSVLLMTRAAIAVSQEQEIEATVHIGSINFANRRMRKTHIAWPDES